jgi:hypothetical protein
VTYSGIGLGTLTMIAQIQAVPIASGRVSSRAVATLRRIDRADIMENEVAY